MKEHQEAIKKFQQAVKENSDNPNIWCSWGVALVELQQFEEAVEKFKTAIENRDRDELVSMISKANRIKRALRE